MRRIKFEIRRIKLEIRRLKLEIQRIKLKIQRIKLVIQLRRFAILGPYYGSCLYITVNIPCKLNNNVTYNRAVTSIYGYLAPLHHIDLIYIFLSVMVHILNEFLMQGNYNQNLESVTAKKNVISMEWQ